uniref:Alpha-ketoglutarate dehydrogenase subunit 4 n=1 Tax=Xiphophorus maculatus TaxID=8083 RepID=A0A3B5Q3S1_XIPMA
MGSKVSSKMAAPTARVIQAVRPHAPLIKFPNRQDVPRPNVQEALKLLGLNVPQHNAPSSASTSSRPQVPLTPTLGTPDSLASVQQLPARYRRRPLTLDEMDYIQISLECYCVHGGKAAHSQ